MLLNGVRARLETAVADRDAELRAARAAGVRGARRRRDDPRNAGAARPAPPADADPPRDRGHLPRAGLRGLGRPGGRDRLGELRRAQHRPGPSVALEARHLLSRRQHDPAHPDVAGSDQGDAERGSRRSTWSRPGASIVGTRPTRRTRRRSSRSSASRSTAGSRSPTCAAPCSSTSVCSSAPSATSACARASSRSPSRRSSSTSPASSATARAARCASTPAGSRWAGAGWVDPDVFRNVGLDPEEWQGFAFGFGIERIAMLRHGLPDLRAFWENDVRVLEQF